MFARGIALLALFVSSFEPSTANSDADCYSSPSSSSCAGFEIPSAQLEQYVQNACTASPRLPACYINDECLNRNPWNTVVCSPARVLASICADSPELPFCRSYTQLCRGSSVVAQCFSHRIFAPIPSLNQAKDSVISLCKNSKSKECRECSSDHTSDKNHSLDCNYLKLWGSLCTQSSTINKNECKNLAKFCEVSYSSSGDIISDLCDKNQTFVLSTYMHKKYREKRENKFSRAFFTFRKSGYFLFEPIYLDSNTDFALATMFLAFLGVISGKMLISKKGFLEEPLIYDSNNDHEDSPGLLLSGPVGIMNMSYGISGILESYLKLSASTSSRIAVFIVMVIYLILLTLKIMVLSSGNLAWIIPYSIGLCTIIATS